MSSANGNPSPPTVLFISPGGLMPVLGGGAARTWGLIRYLRHLNYRVELVTSNHRGHNEEIENEVDRLWLNAPVLTGVPPKVFLKDRFKNCVRLGNDWVKRKLDSNHRSILERNRAQSLELLAAKAACFSRPVAAIATYAWTARALDYMPPGTLRVIDTIDIQHTRAARAHSAGGNLSHIHCAREDEISELNRADVLLAIQQEEGRELETMCPDRKVVTLLHAFDVPEILPATSQEEALLYVGNLYDPNIMGLKSFLQFSWPKIHMARPSSRLLVCGKVCRAISRPPKGVSLEGCVPDLRPYYQRAAIVINPVPYGSGLKIKTVEALAQAKCIVCSEEAIRGLGAPDEIPVVVADVRNEMADRIVSLLRERKQRRKYEKRAWKYAQRNLTAEVVYRPLGHLLAEHSALRTSTGPNEPEHKV